MVGALNSYCQQMPECQTDGCDGNWPLSQCDQHLARTKVNGANDLNCGFEEGLLCICLITISQATCSNQEGFCERWPISQDPLVEICGQRPALPPGFIFAPQECGTFCL